MLLERLRQIHEGRRREPTPRQIAVAIGKEEMNMDEGLRQYDFNQQAAEEKRRGFFRRRGKRG